MSEYVVHYHHERNHQGLGNKLIASIVPDRGQGRIRRRPRLGGLLNYYERAAECTSVDVNRLDRVMGHYGRDS